MKRLISVIVGVLLCLSVCLISLASSETRVSSSGLVKYEVGEEASYIVISAPHGGNKMSGYSRRPAYGCYDGETCSYEGLGCDDLDSQENCKVSTLKDTRTWTIAKELADKISGILGVRPHLIRCDLHRNRMDANRAKDEATFGMANASAVYEEYHGWINHAIWSASKNRTKNILYIDVHGQAGNTNNVVGLLMNNSGPNGLFELTIDDTLAPTTSIQQLHTTSNQTLEELVRGSTSIGGLMENISNFPMVPSPTNKMVVNQKYYGGGFSLRRYAKPPVSGIQIEVNRAIRFGSSTSRLAFADSLSQAIVYWQQNYLGN